MTAIDTSVLFCAHDRSDERKMRTASNWSRTGLRVSTLRGKMTVRDTRQMK
jgi:phage terminase Nu1 subunit (DNA packaging protein)